MAEGSKQKAEGGKRSRYLATTNLLLSAFCFLFLLLHSSAAIYIVLNKNSRFWIEHRTL